MKFGADGYCSFQTAINWTAVWKNGVHPCSGGPVNIFGLQNQAYVNPAQHEYIVIQFNLPDRISYQTSAGRVDLARLQRTSKCSCESTSGRSHYVIECSGMRFSNMNGNLIMSSHRPVDAEKYGCWFCRKIRLSNRLCHTLDPDFRTIDNVRHRSP